MTKKSQSHTLAAVLLAGQRPNNVGVLRSSLYPIYHYEEDLITSSVLDMFIYVAPNETISSSTSISLMKRTTEIAADFSEDSLTSYSSIALSKQTTEIAVTFEDDAQITSASSVALTKTEVLIEYSEDSESLQSSSSIALTKG